MTVTLLVDPLAYDGSEHLVEGDEYRHLFRARRLALGDVVRVVDGLGQARRGEVAGVGRRDARLVLGEPVPSGEPAARLEIFVPFLKGERNAWLVEKATEVGVWAIRFIRTGRSEREGSDRAFHRLRRVAAAAVAQCHRALVPEITGAHELAELESRCREAKSVWSLDPAGGEDWGSLGGDRWVLMVGPEGGWTDAERDLLASWGTVSVSLGERILRAETAALAGAARLLLLGRSVDTARGRG